MLYGFAIINEDESTDFGVVSADNEADAYASVSLESCDPAKGFEIMDLEAVIIAQYRGLAFLSTERC
jgi:hypothetical protein